MFEKGGAPPGGVIRGGSPRCTQRGPPGAGAHKGRPYPDAGRLPPLPR